MSTYSRRQILTAGALGIGGLYGVSAYKVAAVTADSFTAPDQSLLTRDGTVDRILITPHVTITWEGVTAGMSIELALSIGNDENTQTERLETRSDILETTTGTADFAFTTHDILETDVFDPADFSVDTPGEATETDVWFFLDITVSDEDKSIVSDRSETAATLTINRLPEPSIETFAIDDDSNPGRTRCTVSWAVSDEMTDLETVTSALQFDADTEPHEEQTSTVTGTDASGDHEYDIGETDPDGYAITLTVTNAEGIAHSATLAEDEGFTDPGGDSFATLDATITDTERHGSEASPTAATISYESAEAEPLEVTATMEVNDAVSSGSDTGTSGTIDLDLEVEGGPPTDTATITVTTGATETYQIDLTADDGTVSLLD